MITDWINPSESMRASLAGLIVEIAASADTPPLVVFHFDYIGLSVLTEEHVGISENNVFLFFFLYNILVIYEII